MATAKNKTAKRKNLVTKKVFSFTFAEFEPNQEDDAPMDLFGLCCCNILILSVFGVFSLKCNFVFILCNPKCLIV